MWIFLHWYIPPMPIMNQASAVLPWVDFCLSISAKRSFNDIRFKMIRRSISSCVSPDREVPRNLYLHRHRSHHPGAFQVGPQTLQTGTCTYTAPAPPAFCIGSLGTHGKDIENQGRMVRYLDLSSASILRICLAESSSSKITMPISRSASSSFGYNNFFQLAR